MAHYELEGLWGHLASKAPSVEVPELARLIGEDLIKTNSDLWRELKAFSTILTEIHTLEFDKPLTTDGGFPGGSDPFSSKRRSDSDGILLLTEDNLESAKRTDGMGDTAKDVPSLDLAGSRKANNEEQHSEQLTRRSRTSMDSFEFVMSMEECLNVSRIEEVIDKLRDAFLEEKDELEAEIAILYSALDNETDTIAAEAAKDAISSRKKEINKRTMKLDRFSPQGKGGGGGGGYESKEGDCEECSLLRHSMAHQEPGRIRPKKGSGSYSVTAMCTSCEERASKEEASRSDGGGGGRGREKSKVRNKLQAARDEKHFLDDDLF